MTRQQHPWDVRDDETSTAYRAFRVFLELGTNRSVSQAASEMISQGWYKGKITTTRSWLSRWATKYDWHTRVRAYDKHVQDQIDADLIGKLRATAEREANEAQTHMMANSLVAIGILRRYDHDPEAFNRELDDMPLKDLLSLSARMTGPWVQAMQAERLALGLSTENTANAPHGAPDPAERETVEDDYDRLVEVTRAIEEAVNQRSESA